jgi:hypothetical protein
VFLFVFESKKKTLKEADKTIKNVSQLFLLQQNLEALLLCNPRDKRRVA